MQMFLLSSLLSPLGHYEEEGVDDDEKPSGSEGPLHPGHIPQEGEPDFVETNCHWEDCSKEFDTQEELVKVRTVDWRLW